MMKVVPIHPAEAIPKARALLATPSTLLDSHGRQILPPHVSIELVELVYAARIYAAVQVKKKRRQARIAAEKKEVRILMEQFDAENEEDIRRECWEHVVALEKYIFHHLPARTFPPFINYHPFEDFYTSLGLKLANGAVISAPNQYTPSQLVYLVCYEDLPVVFVTSDSSITALLATVNAVENKTTVTGAGVVKQLLYLRSSDRYMTWGSPRVIEPPYLRHPLGLNHINEIGYVRLGQMSIRGQIEILKRSKRYVLNEFDDARRLRHYCETVGSEPSTTLSRTICRYISASFIATYLPLIENIADRTDPFIPEEEEITE